VHLQRLPERNTKMSHLRERIPGEEPGGWAKPAEPALSVSSGEDSGMPCLQKWRQEVQNEC